MSLLTSSSAARHDSERGAILITFTFACVSLLLLAGLAVDSANLYFHRLAAQSAADAAALSGLGVFVGHTYTEKQAGVANANAMSAAYNAGVSNLMANGIDVAQRGTVTPSFNGQRLAVNIDLNVPLYLLGALPNIGGPTRLVRAQGIAAVRSINVSLVLDTSSSMACPETSGEDKACPCVSPTTDCPQDAGSGAKIISLKEAVKTFVDYFEPQRDSMNLVAFSHGADPLVEFTDGDGFNRDVMRAAIDGLQAKGATNMFDGLLTARWDAMDKNQEDVVTVIFTDGAPTATRFTFDRDNIRPGFRNDQEVRNTIFPSGGNWRHYDWINWGLLEGDRTFPGLLYLTPNPDPVVFGRHWDKYKFSKAFVPSPPALVVAAGTPHRSVIDEANPAFALRGGSSGYMIDPIVRFPDETKRRLGRRNLWKPLPEPTEAEPKPKLDPDLDDFNWAGWDAQREHLWMYTDMAIMMTDQLRDAGGTVFVVGYGPSADYPGIPDGVIDDAHRARYICPKDDILCKDPYQNAKESHERKDITNNRLALSVCGWNHPNFFGRDVPALRDEVIRQEGDTLGEYYQTDNAVELQDAFDKIAQEIKMRRVSNR